MRRIRTTLTAAALVGAAILGGTLVSSAFAAPDVTSEPSPPPATHLADGTYLDAYLGTLAAELGVDRDALGPAALAAANAAIDAAVEAGDLDADDAEALRERLAELEHPERLLVRPLGHHGPGVGHPRIGPGIREAAGAAAEALGIEREALVDAFRDGTSLAELAEREGVDYATVEAAVRASVEASLAERVADGTIDQARADRILERLDAWLDEGGEPPVLRHGPRGGGEAPAAPLDAPDGGDGES